MYDKSLEPISAMMDGEIEEFELRRVIERTAGDKELAGKWNRYHLAQDVMKGRSIEVSKDADNSVDLVSRVSLALENEATFSSSAIATAEQTRVSEGKVENSEHLAIKEPKNQWWKPAASMAVAASVTAVVLLGAQQYQQDPLVNASSEYAGVSLGTDDFGKGKFGSELATVSVNKSTLADKQSAYGMEQYIQRHQDLATEKVANWQASWVPKGYKQTAHRVNSQSEVMLFSNGKSAVSINIEPIGAQVASQGTFSQGDLLAFGVRADKKFITVVGAVTAKEAGRIAASVQSVSK